MGVFVFEKIRPRSDFEKKTRTETGELQKKYAQMGFFVLLLSVNDPSAGSPTETLLRLLLPRNVQI